MTICLKISYEGTRYFGWQKTPSGPTIEEELEKALSQILHYDVTLEAASRTDRGVHAWGQRVRFFLHKPFDLSALVRALNSVLPKDIRVLDIMQAHDSFHPTLDAKGKEYVYFVETNPIQEPFDRFSSWHFPAKLDLDAMRAAAAPLIGKHDFSAFGNKGMHEDPIREVTSITITQDRLLTFRITGKSFLYKMVRNLVGTLTYRGLHQHKKFTAPAHGLFLKEIFY